MRYISKFEDVDYSKFNHQLLVDFKKTFEQQEEDDYEEIPNPYEQGEGGEAVDATSTKQTPPRPSRLNQYIDDWTLMDYIHVGIDVASGFADYFLGAGAAVDGVHSCIYFAEAMNEKDINKRKSIFLMGLITAASAILVGPMQYYSVAMKQAIKSGDQVILKRLGNVLKPLRLNLEKILTGLPNMIDEAASSSLGKKLLSREKISIIKNRMKDIKADIRIYLSEWEKLPKVPKTKSNPIYKLGALLTGSIDDIMDKLPKRWISSINVGKMGPRILTNLGFKQGLDYAYHYVGKDGALKGARISIQEISQRYVKIRQVSLNKAGQWEKKGVVIVKIPIEEFIKNVCITPAQYYSQLPKKLVDSFQLPVLRQFLKFFLEGDELSESPKETNIQPFNAEKTSENSLQTLPKDTAVLNQQIVVQDTTYGM